MKKDRSYTIERIKIPSTGRDIKILILRPGKNAKPVVQSSGQNMEPAAQSPGILWIHGGGYVTGMAEMIYMSRAIDLVKKYGAVVITPEYRLAKEAPYPAALEDCYAALKYLKAHAQELGVNDNQLMAGGESAGGGLTAALCMYARDKGEISIAYQMPLYPMIDDRDTESSRDNHAPVWNTRRNHAAWKAYLKGLQEKEVPPYAAAARQTDYTGLPPAYTFVGDIEPFYCETMAYIENLRKAGVEAKVDVYPGCFHAFDMLTPFRKVSRQAIAEFERQYLYAAAHYFAKQPDLSDLNRQEEQR